MANQDYAKSQGWLLEYHVLQSINPRDSEPNIVLITRFKDMPSAAETERRNEILNKRLSQDAHSADDGKRRARHDAQAHWAAYSIARWSSAETRRPWRVRRGRATG